LLTSQPNKTESIHTKEAADALIKKLELSSPQLENLVEALELSKATGNITNSVTGLKNTTTLNKVLCDALVKNEIIVCVQTPHVKPEAGEFGSEPAVNIGFDDSPHPEAKSKKSKDALNVSLSATLDPVSKEFNSIYAKAPAAKIEIDVIADEIAYMFGGHVAKAPIKSQERAIQKIMNDYLGDASKIKDLARNTIIVSPDKVDSVVAELSKRGANVKIINGATDRLGYSGVNSVIKTQAGIFGEVQVNTPAMIYAKESEAVSRILLGDDLYSNIAVRSGITGGQGHKFYEQWRALSPSSIQAETIAQQSKVYYDTIRRANGY